MGQDWVHQGFVSVFFADDVVLLTSSGHDPQSALEWFSAEKLMGLESALSPKP